MSCSIIGTNEDAAYAKLACISKEYYKDDYQELFMTRPLRPRVPTKTAGSRRLADSMPTPTSSRAIGRASPPYTRSSPTSARSVIVLSTMPISDDV